MTCREKLHIEHPESVGGEFVGGCEACPADYGYSDAHWSRPSMLCKGNQCGDCWDLPAVEAAPTIKDSGERREFATGAVRDIQEGKGRCDLLPLDVAARMLCNATCADSVVYALDEFAHEWDVKWLFRALEYFSKQMGWDTCTILLEVAKHFEEGAKKYGEYNWQKGIPVHCYIDSAVRHYLKFMRGDRDEPHDRAFCWNIICAIWTCEHKPELNDYAKRGKENG